mmetsp:Transcript_1629/g.3090  ORF Transcript_1629/g.3090 Transcript_1629/m.3090 type:complete len:115 (-) Transcript_1629:13-357(-)
MRMAFALAQMRRTARPYDDTKQTSHLPPPNVKTSWQLCDGDAGSRFPAEELKTVVNREKRHKAQQKKERDKKLLGEKKEARNARAVGGGEANAVGSDRRECLQNNFVSFCMCGG